MWLHPHHPGSPATFSSLTIHSNLSDYSVYPIFLKERSQQNRNEWQRFGEPWTHARTGRRGMEAAGMAKGWFPTTPCEGDPNDALFITPVRSLPSICRKTNPSRILICKNNAEPLWCPWQISKVKHQKFTEWSLRKDCEVKLRHKAPLATALH